MDIVAESLSAKILKSREVLVNGKDIMDYIRSKLSTAVEFNGVYESFDDVPLSAQFNGSIVIVGSTEYIYSEKPEPAGWKQIGDETAIGQLALDIAAVSSEVSAISEDVDYIKETARTALLSAEAASNTAIQANTAADNAVLSAQISISYAKNALNTANSAKNTSHTALLSAEIARAEAQDAQNAAYSALYEATDARAAAVDAQHKADAALYEAIGIKNIVSNLSNDGYALTSDIPTDLSAFTNSPGYITKTSADTDYQLKSNMSDYQLTSQMSAYEDSRIAISDEISGVYEEKANLSVFKLSAQTYYDLYKNHNIVSNALYIADDDEMNVYGEKITNVLSGTDPTDAATVGQLNLKQDVSAMVDYALVGSNDDLSTANTIYGVKAYTNSTLNALVGTNADLSTANTIYGAKAYTNSILGNLENIINNI